MGGSSISQHTASEVNGIDFDRLYHYRFREVDQAGRRAVWREVARYMYHRLGNPETVLDPAAGRGEFITAVPAPERWAVDAVDQGVDSEDQDVKVIISDIMDADLPRAYFDGVFISNFLEHLPDQDGIADVLSRLRAAMRPGATIAIIGPNFKYSSREYFDCADHTVILTHVSVAEHLHAAGFEVTGVSARFLPYSFRGRLPASPLLTRAYLHFPLAWRLLGKQFLVLARNPVKDPGEPAGSGSTP